MRIPFTARLIPIADREAILGDLFEEAEYRHLDGARRRAWLAAECGSIALGLSFDRVRDGFVVPRKRDVIDGLIFCATVATLALGVEVLVGTLLRAAGF